MRIAYITVNDPQDKKSWSGLTYFIGKTLKENGIDIDFFGPLKIPYWLDKTLRAIAKLNRILFKKEYIAKYSLLMSWYAGKNFNKKLKAKKYDCICAPAAAPELGFLKTKLPVIYITDATFQLISNYHYKEFDKVSRLTKLEGNLLEKHALKISTAVIYPSVWAAQSAEKDYHISNDKIFVSPYGANIDRVPDANIIYNKLDNKQLTILFLAVDWERKGGDIAFEVLKFLQFTHGIQAKLIVCGCVPPAHIKHPNMEVIPFIDKNNNEEYYRFVNIMSTSHFLLVPTRADCSLIVGSESNAYGMPAITTETGGVPEIIKDGINGYCLPYTATANIYAALIAELFLNQKKYKDLIRSSRMQFEQHLTWQKWFENFEEVYKSKIVKRQQQNIPLEVPALN